MVQRFTIMWIPTWSLLGGHALYFLSMSFGNVSEERKLIRNIIIRPSVRLNCGDRALSKFLFLLLRTATPATRTATDSTQCILKASARD